MFEYENGSQEMEPEAMKDRTRRKYEIHKFGLARVGSGGVGMGLGRG